MKIISGGQTGVDRAALDAAIALRIPHGGWCPRGRMAEDGPIPEQYELQETESAEYRVRTERNVRDSDATLILCRAPLSGGTELTARLAEQYERPHRVLDLRGAPRAEEICDWLEGHHVEVINVAGPRESQSPGITEAAGAFLNELFSHWLERSRRASG